VERDGIHGFRDLNGFVNGFSFGETLSMASPARGETCVQRTLISQLDAEEWRTRVRTRGCVKLFGAMLKSFTLSFYSKQRTRGHELSHRSFVMGKFGSWESSIAQDIAALNHADYLVLGHN
jgi:hypothetical protein